MRQTSDVTDTDFPFAEDTVPFILVIREGDEDYRGFEHASTFDKKAQLVASAIDFGDKATLLAAWPGATRTDVFLVDDLEEALGAFE